MPGEIIKLNKKNFVDEVIKSKLPVLVDFWAEWCIDPRTIVSINDRDSVFASTIKKDYYVLGYNGNKIKGYKVVHSKISRVLGHCKRIVTDTGRELKVTDDHRFYTSEGWRRANELNIGDKVAIYPFVELISYKRPKKILISEKDIRKHAFKNMKIDMYIEELRDKGLLPLRFNNLNLLRLARLIGAQFSDGSLYYLGYNNYREISFSVGEIGDVEDLKQDLNNLGFECTYKKKISNCNIDGRSFIMRSYIVRCRSTSLWLLLKALGAPVGNKTNTAYKIPDWLMKADDGLEREFLAAYLGGDGPTVNILLTKRKNKKPYNNLIINDIEFHKRVDLEKSGLILGRQINKLLSKFGIKVKKVFSEDDKYERKDKTKVKIIHIKISEDFESGYNLCQRIGYVYAKQKSLNAKFVGEFLKKRLFERQLCNQKYKEVISLFRKNKRSIKDIALQLGLSAGTVLGWVRYNKKPTIFKHFEKYPMWLKKAKRGLRDGFLWGKIGKIESINLDKVQSLVLEKGHNFIANGFLVHNCGPCKTMAPVIEEIAKEYLGKIKVAKVNVDEDTTLATKYGIMSIPTFLFFKDGKEVSRIVGVVPKKKLTDKIKELQ